MAALLDWISSQPLHALAAVAFGYVLGSIPFGLLLTRLAGLGDIRAIGSGNIGATNVLRTGRKGLAAATLLADALKGTAAALLAASIAPPAGIIAGVAAFLGHLFPVWLSFRGGKGVATYLGVALALLWPAALAFALVWLSVAFLFRYSSLAALAATLAVPLVALVLGRGDVAAATALMAALSWYAHRANIARLLSRTEASIGEKAPPATAGADRPGP
ncbi:MAG: glycerol-3-phosphate 1-O-acyltransferase PlsY [Rhodobiaceae bacterium]|nr:glycerol-3-phosphate 1-O-acyltransferase PlsY [Rhodobiaceae bacterium]MCC0041814.1 glycerol-3-phosphate 1-O-acyltransferase PlsY [Rhodobiaceae bacterium]